jgi:hypothetical protein
MKMFEVDGQSNELAALVQYLMGKSEDLKTKSEMKTDTFIDIARSMGVNITFGNLQALAQQAPLKNMITDLNQDVIAFGDQDPNVKMPVDKARDTVKKMAKRSLGKRI